MSFGPKLEHLPAECCPGEEVIVTLEFVVDGPEFERDLTIYIEEATGIRLIKARVASAPEEPTP